MHNYFMYSEGAEPLVGMDCGLDRPFGPRLDNDVAARLRGGKKACTRARFCGPSARDFLEHMDAIPPLPDKPNAVERERRGPQLLEFSRKAPIAHLDLYLPGEHPHRGVSAQWLLREHIWSEAIVFAIVTQEEYLRMEIPLPPPLFGVWADGEDRGQPLRLAILQGIRHVPRHIVTRLRDIYSLKHVRDAGFGNGTESLEGASPLPVEGGGGQIAWSLDAAGAYSQDREDSEHAAT
jgi:hypothetical protein